MTFCSVIEFGIVSYLHRRIERKKKKKIQTTTENPKLSVEIKHNRISPELSNENKFQSRVNFKGSFLSLNCSERYKVPGYLILHKILAKDYSKSRKQSLM